MAHSDLVLAINRRILQGLSGFGSDRSHRFEVLPQGFDPEDFSAPSAEPGDNNRFTIVYTGTLTEHRRLTVMVQALKLLAQEHPEAMSHIVFELAGVYGPQDLEPLAGSGLESHVHLQGFLPHGRIVEMLKRADVLWMTVGPKEGPTVATSKIYEYIGAQKPILASVPDDSPAAELIAETRSGLVLDPQDHKALALAIYRLYLKKMAGRRLYAGGKPVAKYDRRLIAKQLARSLDVLADRAGLGSASSKTSDESAVHHSLG